MKIENVTGCEWKRDNTSKTWLDKNYFYKNLILSDEERTAYSKRIPIYYYGSFATIDLEVTAFLESTEVVVNIFDHNTRHRYASAYYYEYGNYNTLLEIVNNNALKELNRLGIKKVRYIMGEKKMTAFEKISDKQFIADVRKFNKNIREESLKKMLAALEMPVRSTADSAGYDFKSPMNFTIEPHDTVTIPTGIKCQMSPCQVLMLFPRSSLGFKGMSLANTVGIIDADYYNNESNEGHIMAKVTNNSDDVLVIEKGMKFMQGVFLPYMITSNDNASGTRVGGMGSTGK